MGMTRSQPIFVYESPDNGRTVYARQAGSAQRELVAQDMDPGRLSDVIKENKLWIEIRLAAHNNPALQDALDRVKMIYELTQT